MSSFERFATAAGTVSAGLLAPLAVAVVAADGSLPYWFWLAVFVGSGFIGGFVGVRAAITPSAAERFRGGWRVVVPFACTPVLLAVGYAVDVTVSLDPVVVWAPIGTGVLLTALGGLLLASTARSLYGTRLTDETETAVALPPEQTETERRRERLAGVVLLGGIVVASAWLWVSGREVSILLFVAVAPLSLLFDTREERTAVDAGLKQGAGVEPWDSFAGYRVTDDHVVLTREKWYRSDVRIDRDRLDDEGALVDVLSAVVPEDR